MRIKNKQIMMSVLALNVVGSSFLGAGLTASNEKLYNKMLKNIETGKSNEEGYKLIETILKKRNKELKDLYLQGDYIVKPEYLEWQVFFSGFYTDTKRGDNTLENAEYYSMPKTNSGDNKISSEVYNSILNSGVSEKTLEMILNGNIAVYNNLSDYQKNIVSVLFEGQGTKGQFKPFQNIQQSKIIDLGISLSIAEPNKKISDISISGINLPDINISQHEFTEPSSLNLPEIDLVTFNPSIPNITTINFNPIPVLNLNGTGGGNGGITGFFPYGDPDSNSIISQMDIVSGTISVRTDIDPDFYEPNSPGFYSYTLDNVVGNPSAGLAYNDRQVYDPVSMTWTTESAVLPTGIYSDSILNNPVGYSNRVQGIFKVIDNPITRLGVAGGNVEDFKVILEGDVVNASYLEQILHFDEHYSGIYDPISGMNILYTLDDLESQNWITSAEKTELGDKFLDTTLGFTTANRHFQYVENNGSWYLKGSDVVAVNLQAHSGYQDANSIFMNRGNIIGLNEASSTNNLIGKQVAFMFTEGQSIRKQEGFDNTGKIHMRAPQSVGFLFTSGASSYNYNESSDSSGNIYINENPGKHILMNNGEMKFYGNSNIGVYSHNGPLAQISESESYYLDGSWNKNESISNGLHRSEIRLYSPLTILGDESIGVDIERDLNFANSKIKVDVGTEDPRQSVTSSTGVGGLENSGNTIGGDNRYTDNSTGIYINMTSNNVYLSKYIHDEINPANDVSFSGYAIRNSQFTLSDYLLNVGSYSRSGAGIRVEKYGDLVLGSSSDTGTTHVINLLAGGEGNAGIYLHGTNETSIQFEPYPIWNPGYMETATLDGFLGAKVTTDGLILNIDGNKQVGAQIEEYGYFYHNNGVITVNGTNNTGMAVKTVGTGEVNNTGIINVSSGNLGVYNNGIFNMNGGNITANGQSSVGIYSETSNIDTNLNGGVLRAENGGIGLYAGSGSTINLNQGINLIAGNKGLLFYNYDSGSPSGNYSVTGNVKATVEEGGIAFYLKYGMNLENYLNTSFTGISGGNLGLTMQSGSILYLIEGDGSTVSLTALDGMVTPTTNLANNVNVSSDSASDYIPISMNKGTLILNRNIDLDGGDLYKRAQLSSLSVTLDGGVSLTGMGSNELGIAQKNYLGTAGIDDIKLTNNGTINLGGIKSVGMTADYGHIINNNLIETTGSDSIGIYSGNGTLTENNGQIVVGGNKSAGIYGVNYFDGVTSSSVLGYGNDKINIVNNGSITSSGAGEIYGIYANNTILPNTDSQVTLQNGSSIDLSSSNGGVGIYANNSTVTGGGGTLTVGSNGLGIYAKDSEINLSSLTLNLVGDNSLGFYLDGTTNFTGTGNINISGQNVTIFNIKSTGLFNQNFNISSTAGSSYAVGNINNGTFYYNGTSNLGGNGSLLSGVNSAVLLDTGSVINGTGDSIVGVAMDGQYTGSSPFTAGIDLENRGSITLGNNSSGLYGKDGVRIRNTGTISVGSNSISLYTTGAGSLIENNGTLSLGSNSVGVYGLDSISLKNSSNILSNQSEAVGIYSDGTTALTIENTGLIDLTGNKSMGIYSKSTGGTALQNNGTIIIGDSLDNSNPGIGIYGGNSLDTITNNGTITTGLSSVGIYTNGGLVNQSATINVGNDGVGIYSNGGTINLNTGSLNVSDNGSIGVYGANGTSIINDGITTIGNNSYGYVLGADSSILNNTATTIGDSSVFIYGNASGYVINNGIITMSGSNSIGFYVINGGGIQNSGDIAGTSGTANVGIYNENGSIQNSGNIYLGDSVIVDLEDSTKNSYAIGIYGDGSTISNYGNIELGYYGVGIYSKNAPYVYNSGNITSSSEGVIGLFVENGDLQNTGNIDLTGNNSIGIYANKKGKVSNSGTITMGGNDSTGIYLNLLSTLDNQGTININGNNSQGILLKGGSTLLNGVGGTINISGSVTGSTPIGYGGTTYPVPSIINAGVINVSENFEAKGIDVLIKVDPSTITAPTSSEDMGASFVSDAVKFYAPEFTTTEPIGILPGFSAGTHENVYKLKDVFNPLTTDGGPNSGLVKVLSKSLTWTATPVLNKYGNVDIWMQKIPYDNFTSGLWYEDFGLALDSKFTGSKGKAGEIFDKIDTIETELDFRRTMGSLAGEAYANMNQREETITKSFENALSLLQDSSNNTKENVKINIIAGKGKSTEDTDGVLDYDYTTTGVLALREVERTYRHTFGYSLGYMHTNFDLKDGNKSEEKADTLQLGLHNKYKQNDWVLKNDLTGRVSFHDMERNIDWTKAGESKMTGNYEVYSITSDNILGKEISLSKNSSLTPYGGMKLEYMTRPSFKEDGLEALEVEGNDAWSVKPKVGMELKGELPLGNKETWKLKSSLDLSYEYELSNLNVRENARLIAVEDRYHKLSKPEEDKGIFITRASLGVEIEDRYGIFLTGEYGIGNSDQDDYRAGVSLKAIF